MRTSQKMISLMAAVAVLLTACGTTKINGETRCEAGRWNPLQTNVWVALGDPDPYNKGLVCTDQGFVRLAETAANTPDGQLYTLPNRDDPNSIDSAPQGTLALGGTITYRETGRSDKHFTAKFTVDEGFALSYRGWEVNGHEGGVIGLVMGPVTTTRTMDVSDGALELVPVGDIPHYLQYLYVIHCRGFDSPTGSTTWTYKPWDVRTDLLPTTLGEYAKYWPANYPASCPKSADDEARFWADPSAWTGPVADAAETTEEVAAVVNTPAPAVVYVAPANPTATPAAIAAAAATYDITTATARLATGDFTPAKDLTVQPGVNFCASSFEILEGEKAGNIVASGGCWSLPVAVKIHDGVGGTNLYETDIAGRPFQGVDALP